MKKINIVLSLSAFLALNAPCATFANDQYLEAMQKCIAELYKASDVSQLQHTVNTLERIASVETLKWHPQYYIAFGHILMATREPVGTKKDGHLDLAMKAIEKAKQLVPQESEVIALEGFVYMMRVTVDPQSRGPELAPVALQTFGRALHLNSENPRALTLLAQMQFGTAKFFGSSTDEACALVRQALGKFAGNNNNNNNNTAPLFPSWGKAMAESLLLQCKDSN